MSIVTAAPDKSLKLRRSGMTSARPEHAAPMGLERVLLGVAYYKHVAPTELAGAAQRPASAAGASRH